MMTLLFGFASEKVLITIDGNSVWFSSTEFGAQKAPIDGLNLSYEGVLKEHPDLEDDPDWKGKTIARFKEKVKSFKTEEKTAKYIIDDLAKFGYVFEWKQKKGFRPVRAK